jgi:hypothetical protein
MKSKLRISENQKRGGVVSEVTEAQMHHNGSTHQVVIKRTHKKVSKLHFSHTDVALQDAAPKTHRLDRKILERLQGNSKVIVPKLHKQHSKGLQTVMTDFNSQGYTLMQDLLVKDRLPESTAVNAARTLAEIQIALRDNRLTGRIKPIENSKTQIRERLAEAHILLYGDLKTYREIEAKLLSDKGLLYTDGHPKNMAVSQAGKVMVFDFGRIITGSQQYVPANFLAHIGLAWIGGVMDSDRAKAFINDFYKTFNGIIPIEKDWFVKFFVAELVHRGLAMRWVDPRLFKQGRETKAKLAAYAVFLDVFDKNKNTLAQLLDSIEDNSKY